MNVSGKRSIRIAVMSDPDSGNARRALVSGARAEVLDFGSDRLPWSLEVSTEAAVRFLRDHGQAICIAISASGSSFAIEANKHAGIVAAQISDASLAPEAVDLGARLFELPTRHSVEEMLWIVDSLRTLINSRER